MCKNRLIKWWYFKVKNPIIRQGEHGGFKWCFRRFTLDISTLSGNFSARFTADEHPYAYLLLGKTDDNIVGFCQVMYMLGKTLTTDQGLVNDVQKAFKKHQTRIEKQAKVVEDETEETVSIEEEKSVLEHTNMPAKEARKIDRKFKKTAKKVKDEEKSGKEG